MKTAIFSTLPDSARGKTEPMKIEYETSRIFALDQLDLCRSKDLIDWGLAALRNGSTSINVAILAGINPQTSYFEAREDFVQALNDGDIEFIMGGEAIDLYLGQAAEKIIEGSISYEEFLKIANEVCFGWRGWNSKYDISAFFGLYRAIDDLKCGEEGWNYYFQDLNTIDPAKTVSLECQIMLGRIHRKETPKFDERLPLIWEEEPGWFGRAKEMISWLFHRM
jgi:hypothetical protein